MLRWVVLALSEGQTVRLPKSSRFVGSMKAVKVTKDARTVAIIKNIRFPNRQVEHHLLPVELLINYEIRHLSRDSSRL